MLRLPLGLAPKRFVLPPLPIPTWCTQRNYASAPKASKEATTSTSAAGKKSVRDSPTAFSNLGRKWWDKDWKKKQRLNQIALRNKALAKKSKLAAEKAKKSPNQQVSQKSTKHLQRADSQSMQTIQKYDRENQRKTRKAGGDGEEGDIRDGDFLFQYARFNLGEQGLNRLVSVHVREAMWQLYDADSDFWTPARLGTKFGFSLETTLGIILMQAYEKFLMRRWDKKMQKFYKEEEERRLICKRDKRQFRAKKKPFNYMLSDELELGLGDEFGWKYTEGLAPTPPGGFGLFSDIAMVGDQLDMGLLARAAFKVAPPPRELPNKPPPIYIPARQISGPTRANKLHRARLLIVDIDKTRKGKMKKMREDQRFMMIRELDGSLRTPSWKERLNIQEHYIRAGSLRHYHLIARDPLAYYNTRATQRYKGKH